MTIAGDIAAYEAACSAGYQPIRQQLHIEIRDIREVLSLAHTLSFSLSETAKEFSEAVDRGYSNSALEDAVSFRLQRDVLIKLRHIYEEETGKSALKTGCFSVPE
jgi:hypothetical protein